MCVVTDAALARGRALAEVVRDAIAGGADVVQFRDKTAGARAWLAAALPVRAVCRAAAVPFVVNDRADLALALDADGLHVGQDDLPAEFARQLIGPGRVLGVSVATPAQAAAAAAAGADYLGVGPVFDARASKPDAALPIGLDGLAAVCAAARGLPVLAIGGIGPANAAAVVRAGATGVAVISCVVAAEDVAAAARALRTAVDAGRVPPP